VNLLPGGLGVYNPLFDAKMRGFPDSSILTKEFFRGER
jgi:hypothetical protein